MIRFQYLTNRLNIKVMHSSNQEIPRDEEPQFCNFARDMGIITIGVLLPTDQQLDDHIVPKKTSWEISITHIPAQPTNWRRSQSTRSDNHAVLRMIGLKTCVTKTRTLSVTKRGKLPSLHIMSLRTRGHLLEGTFTLVNEALYVQLKQLPFILQAKP